MENLSKLGTLNPYPSFNIIMGNNSLEYVSGLLKNHYELHLYKSGELDEKVKVYSAKIQKFPPVYYELGRIISDSRLIDFKIHQNNGIYTITTMPSEEGISFEQLLQRVSGFHSYLKTVGSFK